MGQVTIKSEIAAKIWKIEVAVGMQVPEGETLILLKSMKMEIPILAPVAGAIVNCWSRRAISLARARCSPSLRHSRKNAHARR